MSTPTERPDHYIYQWVSFNFDTFAFLAAPVRFYESLLDADVNTVRNDEDRRTILDERA